MFDQAGASGGTAVRSREQVLLDRIAATAKQIAHLQARQIHDMAALRQSAAGTEHGEFVAEELAMTLTMSPTAAESKLDLAEVLTGRLPRTLQLLSRGEIDLYRAMIVAEVTAHLDEEVAAAVEDKVIDRAPSLTSTQLRAKLRKAVLEADPQGAEQRRKRAREDRTVRVYGEADAMASLSALLPAEDALVVFKSVDQLARAAARDPGETRTLEQLRADFLTQIHREILETGSWGRREMKTPRRAQPHLQITIDLLTLLSLRRDPAHLDGYGPVPPELARMLAEDATWQRFITDPVGGQLLDYGTTRYAPGPVLDAHVVTRDQQCRFPGCTRPAATSDLDHTMPYPAGPTAHWNLGPLCRRHHRAKQAGFDLRQTAPGVFRWRSPTGVTRTVRPPSLAPPKPGLEATPDQVATHRIAMQRLTKIALKRLRAEAS